MPLDTEVNIGPGDVVLDGVAAPPKRLLFHVLVGNRSLAFIFSRVIRQPFLLKKLQRRQQNTKSLSLCYNFIRLCHVHNTQSDLTVSST